MYRHLIFIVFMFAMTVFIYGKPFERTIDIEAGKQLKVEMNAGGSITVDGWDQNQVKIVLDSDYNEWNENDIDISKNSKGVYVEIRSDGHGNRSHGPDLHVYVPAKFDLDLQTMGGSINITGVEGEFEGQTMGGSLNLSGLNGDIGMTTMGGSIAVENSRLEGEVKTMGGSIDFDNVTGGVKATTMGGSVSMKNKKAGTTGKDMSEVKVSTMGGEIDIDDAPNGADVHTMGGDITVNSAKKFVKAKTMGGDINIEEIDGWVKATTMGGDITVNMVGDASGSDQSVELSSMGGEIVLTLPKNIDADFDIHLVYTKDSRKDYEIKNDFGLKIEEKYKDWDYSHGQAKKELVGSGKTGSGKHTIYVKTVNGNITIKKSK